MFAILNIYPKVFSRGARLVFDEITITRLSALENLF